MSLTGEKLFFFSCLDSIFVGEKVSSEKAETIVEVNRLWSGDNTASNKRFPAALFSFHCDDIVAAKKRLNLLWKSDINYTLRRCIKLEEGSRCDVHFKRQLNYWGWGIHRTPFIYSSAVIAALSWNKKIASCNWILILFCFPFKE